MEIVEGLSFGVPFVVFHFTVSMRLLGCDPASEAQSLVVVVAVPFPLELMTFAPSPVPPLHAVVPAVLTLRPPGLVPPLTSAGLILICPTVAHVPTAPVPSTPPACADVAVKTNNSPADTTPRVLTLSSLCPAVNPPAVWMAKATLGEPGRVGGDFSSRFPR